MDKATVVLESIKNRRTIKPEACNGERIPDAAVWEILEAANWAPTHGYTEPWRFIVFSDEAKFTFSQAHAAMYKKHTSEADFKQIKYDKIVSRAGATSHIVAIVNKKGDNPKIPEIEELQATAMAVQNMQLLASAMGYAAYINSGGMTYTKAMKDYLGFGEADKVLGFLYLGIPAEAAKAGRRVTKIQDKVQWKNK